MTMAFLTQSISCRVSPSSAALSQGQPSSAGTCRGSRRAQGHTGTPCICCSAPGTPCICWPVPKSARSAYIILTRYFQYNNHYIEKKKKSLYTDNVRTAESNNCCHLRSKHFSPLSATQTVDYSVNRLSHCIPVQQRHGLE